LGNPNLCGNAFSTRDSKYILCGNAFLYNGALQTSSPARERAIDAKSIETRKAKHAEMDCHMGDMSYARMVRGDFKVMEAQFSAAHLWQTFRNHIQIP
jgi:hypothetical protein